MPQLLALEEWRGTSSGEGGLMMEGIVEPAASVLEALLPSEKRPLFFLATAAADTAVGLEGPAAAQKDSAIFRVRESVCCGDDSCVEL